MTDQTHLTSVEVQLLSRSRRSNPGTSSTDRHLCLAHNSPRAELEAAVALVASGHMLATFSGGVATWYELTPAGLQYFHITWPNRRD